MIGLTAKQFESPTHASDDHMYRQMTAAEQSTDLYSDRYHEMIAKLYTSPSPTIAAEPQQQKSTKSRGKQRSAGAAAVAQTPAAAAPSNPTAQSDSQVVVTQVVRKTAKLIKDLKIKIISAEMRADGKKLTVYYSADGYVDFRLLQRALYRRFQCRIWLV